jgi:nicotinamide-nucleotide amidase
MSIFPDDVLRQAERLLVQCCRRKQKIATAESCTGGLVIAALTEIAGSSAVVERGFITYSNEAKEAMLGVSNAVLKQHGAVSEPVARAMAQGALKQSQADFAVAITGIAGPGGGSAKKPVGLVHIAAASASTTTHQEFRFGEIGRNAVRTESVRAALKMLAEMADQSSV